MADEGESQIKSMRQRVRILKLLNGCDGIFTQQNRQEGSVKLAVNRKIYSFDPKQISWLCRQNLVALKGDKISITDLGVSHLKRCLHPQEPYIAQHSQLKSKSVQHGGGVHVVKLNENESPLLRLYTRKNKAGKSWIDANEFQAGERLRKDFEKAGMQPRISANWEASVAVKGRGGSKADISDFALDAKKRIDKAILALGPELSGIALDICCFLRGLESVERQKNWPPRSAKLMLKTALAQLARHYGISQTNHSSSTRAWGGENYRPEIGR